jgi:glyoxylase-like metal-dependent hydrolase (beta-lactamase superfamily II)
MVTIARELVEITPAVFLWHSYDQAVKADLFSTALVARGATFIVDPIPLHVSQFSQLQQRGRVAGVVTTNTNHQRAAAWYSEQFSAPIFAHRDTFPEAKPDRFVEIRGGTKINEELEVIELEGAVAGEVALYHAADGGALIIGDALINFEPYGFNFLPRKYCINEKRMRRSLRKLLDFKIKRMLFAHGTPILSGASARLRQLVDVDL